MSAKKATKAKREPKSLRGLIRALPDRIKAELVRTLVTLAKSGDARASTLYARFSGESGAFTSAIEDHCCVTVTLQQPLDAAEQGELDAAEDEIAYRLHGVPRPDEPEDEPGTYTGDYR